MNKHILKKFLHEVDLSDDIVKVISDSPASIPITANTGIKQLEKDHSAYLITEDNKMFKAFVFSFQNKRILVPEPDPVLVYFHAAYVHYSQLANAKKEILDKLVQPEMTEPMIKELYDYFAAASSFVILLFTAMEAVINRGIPRDYLYEKKTKQRTESYSKQQIERYLSFDEKLKDVLVKATKKDFAAKFSKKFQHIQNLKEFRDMIVHTKEAEGESTYDYLFRKSLTFNYTDAINAVKDFCNFYTTDNFVEECPCSNLW